MNSCLTFTDANMTDHRAKFLSEPCLVHRCTAFAFDMCRHGNYRGNRQHAGTANASHYDVPGLLRYI